MYLMMLLFTFLPSVTNSTNLRVAFQQIDIRLDALEQSCTPFISDAKIIESMKSIERNSEELRRIAEQMEALLQSMKQSNSELTSEILLPVR